MPNDGSVLRVGYEEAEYTVGVLRGTPTLFRRSVYPKGDDGEAYGSWEVPRNIPWQSAEDILTFFKEQSQ